MGDWQIFWYGMAIIAAVGVISALVAPKINESMKNVEYYARGHVTDHHKYEPFD
jgi:hypothetical protein